MRCLNLKTRLVSLIIFSLCIFVVTSPCYSSIFRGEITEDGVNVRSDARINSPAICTLRKGQIVSVVIEYADWYKIILPKEASAFIKSYLIERAAGNNAKVKNDRVNVRLSGSESAPIIGRLEIDTIIEIIEEKDGWCKIVPTEDTFGWVHKRFVSKTVSSEEQPKELPAEQPTVQLKEPTVEPIAKETTKAVASAGKYTLETVSLSLEAPPAKTKPEPKIVKEVPAAKESTKEYPSIFSLPAGRQGLSQQIYSSIPSTALGVNSAEKTNLPARSNSTPELKQQTLNETKESADITVEGIVRSYGKVFNRAASHKLETKDRKIYLLKGDKDTLEPFALRKVKVTGKLSTLAHEKYPIIEVNSIEASP